MKNKLILCIGATVALAVATLAAPQIQSAISGQLSTAKARALKSGPQTYWIGEVGIHFAIHDVGISDYGDKRVVVTDMNPSDPRLFASDGQHVLIDDRAPASGTVDLNGHILPLTFLPTGELTARLPQAWFDWVGGNNIDIEVFDANHSRIAGHGLAVGPLL